MEKLSNNPDRLKLRPKILKSIAFTFLVALSCFITNPRNINAKNSTQEKAPNGEIAYKKNSENYAVEQTIKSNEESTLAEQTTTSLDSQLNFPNDPAYADFDGSLGKFINWSKAYDREQRFELKSEKKVIIIVADTGVSSFDSLGDWRNNHCVILDNPLIQIAAPGDNDFHTDAMLSSGASKTNNEKTLPGISDIFKDCRILFYPINAYYDEKIHKIPDGRISEVSEMLKERYNGIKQILVTSLTSIFPVKGYELSGQIEFAKKFHDDGNLIIGPAGNGGEQGAQLADSGCYDKRSLAVGSASKARIISGFTSYKPTTYLPDCKVNIFSIGEGVPAEATAKDGKVSIYHLNGTSFATLPVGIAIAYGYIGCDLPTLEEATQMELANTTPIDITYGAEKYTNAGLVNFDFSCIEESRSVRTFIPFLTNQISN